MKNLGGPDRWPPPIPARHRARLDDGARGRHPHPGHPPRQGLCFSRKFFLLNIIQKNRKLFNFMKRKNNFPLKNKVYKILNILNSFLLNQNKLKQKHLNHF